MLAIDSILSSTDVVNNLGVYLDSELTLERQVSKLSSLLFPPASSTRGATIALGGLPTDAGSCLRHQSSWSLQQPPLRILLISSRPASVRAEFCCSPGSEHSKVQRNLSCHPRWATLAPDQKANRVQNCSSRATLSGRRCARVLDGTVSPCQFGRRSAKPPVCFQRRPYRSSLQTPNIRFPSFCYLGPSALELNPIGH